MLETIVNAEFPLVMMLSLLVATIMFSYSLRRKKSYKGEK
jgi:hypothetical protein